MKNAGLFNNLSNKSQKALKQARTTAYKQRPCFNVPKEVFNKYLHIVTQDMLSNVQGSSKPSYADRIRATRKLIDKLSEKNTIRQHFTRKQLKTIRLQEDELLFMDTIFDRSLETIGL